MESNIQSGPRDVLQVPRLKTTRYEDKFFFGV